MATSSTAHKMQFTIKDFISKCDQIRRKLRIWSYLLKKSLMENCIFVQCSLKTTNISLNTAFWQTSFPATTAYEHDQDAKLSLIH